MLLIARIEELWILNLKIYISHLIIKVTELMKNTLDNIYLVLVCLLWIYHIIT